MVKRKNINVDNKAYCFRIEPDEEQKVFFAKTFGCCRYIWNRMLADRKKYYEETGKTFKNTPAAYKQDPECEWLKEVDSLAFANVQLHLNDAYEAFFKGKRGFPKFKKKNVSKESYTTNSVNDNIKLDGNMLKLPKLKSPVKVVIHRPMKQGGVIKSVTVTKEPDGKYYASVLMEYPKTEIEQHFDPGKAIGLDMSVKEFFVSSDGELGDYPRFYRQNEAKLAREQRKLSRMQRNSNNYKKQQQKVALLHAKTKHQRSDFLHKLSRSIVDRYDIVCIEDLDMKAMAQSLNFGKSVCDNGWGMFSRMLAYKINEKGGKLVKIDKWFPSSKTCSECGYKHDSLTLADRVYICPNCGNIIDRDYQAAVNIKREGLRMIAQS